MERSLEQKAVENLEAIQEMADKLGYPTQVISNEEITVPTMMLFVDDYDGEDIPISCSVIPMEVGGLGSLFLQYYTCIIDEIPQDKKEVINEYIKRQNESFMIGNVLTFMDGVCLKYALYLDPDEPLDEVFIARALDIFTFEAKVLTEKIQSIIDEKLDLESALSTGAFYI